MQATYGRILMTVAYGICHAPAVQLRTKEGTMHFFSIIIIIIFSKIFQK